MRGNEDNMSEDWSNTTLPADDDTASSSSSDDDEDRPRDCFDEFIFRDFCVVGYLVCALVSYVLAVLFYVIEVQ